MSISCRFPPSLIAFGFLNYFNWFIYYHVTAWGKESPPSPCHPSDFAQYVAAGWMQARSSQGGRKIWVRKEISKWMLVCSKGEKFSWLEEEEDILAKKLGSELKKMGAVVVLNDISRLLDEVVNEQWNFFSGRLDWEITQFTLDFFT